MWSRLPLLDACWRLLGADAASGIRYKSFLNRASSNMPTPPPMANTSSAASSSGRRYQALVLFHREPVSRMHVLLVDDQGFRKTMRPGARLPWLSFLVGSGVTAVGFAAFQTHVDVSKPAAFTLESVSLSPRSLLKWPWRSASASGAGDMVLPEHSLPQQLPDITRPPLLPGPPPPSSSSGSRGPLTRTSISDAASKVSEAVVHLVVGEDQAAAAAAAAAGTIGPARSSGSGIIYDQLGFIITNAHVVAAAAGDKAPLVATMQDGRAFRGRVISMDKAADIAVVKIDSHELLPAACFGSSADLQAGAWVVALGSPLTLKHSVTAGIVSCVERRGTELGLASARTGYIQTDAAINQGNSGGPLCSLDGEVVGINMMKAVAADGVSFAIPADAVREIVRHFHLHGRVIRPYIGISMLEVSSGGLKQLKERVPGLPIASQSAIVIQKVVEGSPAMVAGLQAEDLLLAVAGEKQLSMSQVIEKFTSGIGQAMEVQVLRCSEGQYQVVTKRLVPMEAPS